MDVPKETVEEFMRLYEKEFGEALSFDDARLRFEQVLDLYVVLSQLKGHKNTNHSSRTYKNSYVEDGTV